MKKAFSLLEVILVITVVSTLLFFLSSKYVNVTSYSDISNAKATYSMIKSSLLEKRTKAVLRNSSFISKLDDAALNKEKEELFSNVLKTPIISSKKGWMKSSDNRYYVVLKDKKVYFEYSNRLFFCINTNEICKELE